MTLSTRRDSIPERDVRFVPWRSRIETKSNETANIKNQPRSEVDYKTATHKLQGIVKELSNEGSFRSYAAQEPLVRKHYEASKTIDERAKDMAKKPVLSIPTRFGAPAAWRLKLRRFTSVEPLSYEQVRQGVKRTSLMFVF